MIRKREEKDTEHIIRIWQEASKIAHAFLADDFVEKAKKDLRDVYLPLTDTWVYEDDHGVIGFISMLGQEIGGLFVWPHDQKKGIGTQLVNFVKAFHSEMQVDVFEENALGRAFYDKYGFVMKERYFHAASGSFVLRLHYPA